MFHAGSLIDGPNNGPRIPVCEHVARRMPPERGTHHAASPLGPLRMAHHVGEDPTDQRDTAAPVQVL